MTNNFDPKEAAKEIKNILESDPELPGYQKIFLLISEKMVENTATEEERARIATLTCLSEMCAIAPINIVLEIHDYYHGLMIEKDLHL